MNEHTHPFTSVNSMDPGHQQSNSLGFTTTAKNQVKNQHRWYGLQGFTKKKVWERDRQGQLGVIKIWNGSVCAQISISKQLLLLFFFSILFTHSMSWWVSQTIIHPTFPFSKIRRVYGMVWYVYMEWMWKDILYCSHSVHLS